VNLDNVRRDDWILGGVALLLAIDLIVFPWFHVSVGIGAFSVSANSSGTGTPDGWLGVLAMLASLLVLADLLVERLAPQIEVPAIGGSRVMTRFVLAVAAAVFMALKFLFHIHFSLFGWGFYLGVVLVVALLVFATQARQVQPASGGVVGGPAGPAGPATPTASTSPAEPMAPAQPAAPAEPAAPGERTGSIPPPTG
jgi:hypothetical protein